MRPRQPSPNTGFWTPSPDFLAQVNHALVGLLIFPFVFVAHWPAWIPLTCILVWAAVKEFILDLFVLEHDTIGGSVEDATFYVLGALPCYLALTHFALGASLFAVVLLGLTAWDIADQHLNIPVE